MEQPTDEQATRAGNRERQRRHREREAQKRACSIEAQRLASERAERTRRDLHFFGESSPGCDANNFVDELQIHREFLRALGNEDVKDGETLRTVAKRAFETWLTGPFTCRSHGPIYVPAFDRTCQQFDPDFGFAIDDVLFGDVWTPPKDCTGDEHIDVGALRKLPKLSKAKPKTSEAKVEPSTPPTQAPPGLSPQQQPDAINFAWIPPDAQRYLHGGTI